MGDATQAAYGVGYSLAAFPYGVTLLLLLTLVIYLRGWQALGRTRPDQIPAWRAACFAGGIVAVWAALASPLDALSGVLLTAHMIQHLLLMSVAPPLLVLGAPVVPMLRGLPRYFVREGLGPFFTLRPVRAIEQLLHSRVFAWLVLNVTFIGWHVPAAYGLALRSPGWHEVEHVCFLLTSILFWWHIVAPWPTLYTASRWLLLPFLLSADLVNTALSASLAFSGKVFYREYASVPRFFGLSVMDDQVAAGSLMWVVGSVSFLGAAMLTTVALLSRKGERRKAGRQAERARATALRRADRPLSSGPQARQPWRYDLFKVRPIGAFFKARHGRQSLQAVSLVLAAALVADGLFGHQMGSMNLAGIVPWTFARALFVMGLLLIGNLFCMSCPFTLPRELAKWVARRFGLTQLPWPRALRNKWLAAGLVVLFFWAFTAMDLWNAPARTAVLLLGYFTVTFAVDTVFRGASFCKYVCPLGQFNFAASLLSPVGVAARSTATCDSCSTRDCIAGHQAPRPQKGCELNLFMPAKQGNLDCTLCMDCVKACPHDNIGLFVQVPAAELVQLAVRDPQRSAVGRYRDRLDLAVLAGVVVAAGFANAAVMVEPVTAAMDRWSAHISARLGASLGLLVAFSLPAALLGLLWLAMPREFGPARRRHALPQWTLALLPVGLGMWAAHLVLHLLTGWGALVPGTLQAGHDFARLGLPFGGWPTPEWGREQALVGVGSILPVQMGLLDAGLLGTLYLGWRLTASGFGVLHRASRLLPWASVAAALYAAGVWILLQPMQMRGMAGM